MMAISFNAFKIRCFDKCVSKFPYNSQNVQFFDSLSLPLFPFFNAANSNDHNINKVNIARLLDMRIWLCLTRAGAEREIIHQHIWEVTHTHATFCVPSAAVYMHHIDSDYAQAHVIYVTRARECFHAISLTPAPRRICSARLFCCRYLLEIAFPSILI